MSRKSLLDASKRALKRTSKIGLSSLAVGSVTFGVAGLLHAQNATPTNSSAKPKESHDSAARGRKQSRNVGLAASGALPSNGAGLIAQTAPAPAANVPAPTAATGSSASELQEIVVAGIRGSLERALQIKKMSLGVVDAISAEDIGQFPDSSIGEAIGRIPGVTVNRGSLNQMSSAGAPTATGAVTGITVRGFGDQFNELLVDGRQEASGNGQNFDYSTMSANYVGEVEVHKTPDFSLSAGAVGATINVKFPNPFDNPGMHAQAFGSATDYQLDGGTRPAFGGLWSDTFADGEFGFLIDGDYTDHHIYGNHQDIVGWKAADLPCSAFNQNYTTAFGSTGCATVGSGATATAAVPAWYPQDMAMYVERTDSRRKDGRASFQWHPTDNVLVTLDDNYSSDDEHQDRFQRSTWFGVFPNNGAANVVLDGNGTITDFTDVGPTDFNSFVADTYIVTNTPGINVVWDLNDDWTTELDADQSTSKMNPNGTITDIDVDTGYGPNTSVGTNEYSGGIVISQNPKVLPYWSATGPNTVATGASPVSSPNYLGLNPFIIGSHVVPIQTQQNTDKINEAKLDATWHAGSTKVNFGFQYLDDLWNTKEMDTLVNNYWQLWAGYGPGSNNYKYYCAGTPPYSASGDACASQTNPPPGAVQVTHGVSLPSSYFSPLSVGTWMPGYSGAGNLPQSVLEYNPYAVLSYLEKQAPNADWAPSSGYSANYTGGLPLESINTGSVQHVDRTNYSPFVTAEHNFDISDMTLKVGGGLRWVRTQETISGLASTLLSLSTEPGDVTAYGLNTSSAVWTTKIFSYNYVLPSLDLNLMVLPDLKLRADASRTETAPNNNQLIPNTTYAGRVGSLGATGNNPDLLPYLSNNFDLGAEWYYGSNDDLTVDTFYKHVTQFPVSSITTITVPGVIATSPLDPNYGHLAQFTDSTVTNGLGANVTGVEVGWQQMLMWGFGYQVNGTYAHTSANFNNYLLTGNQFSLPGIGNSANFIGFYQRHGLQARVTVQWQADELTGEEQEQNGGIYAPEPVYLKGSTEVDFSTRYDINSHLSAYFEALNLTDAIYDLYGRFSNQTLDLVNYGRSFTAGVRVKF